jgi:hypothetical protein
VRIWRIRELRRGQRTLVLVVAFEAGAHDACLPMKETPASSLAPPGLGVVPARSLRNGHCVPERSDSCAAMQPRGHGTGRSVSSCQLGATTPVSRQVAQS